MESVRARRPRPTARRSPSEWTLDGLALGGVLLNCLIITVGWLSLPASVPSHFGFSGTPTTWSGRAVLWLLPSVSLLIFTGLTVLGRYPHVFNYPWPITTKNADRQYRLARLLLGWVKLEVVWLFAYITAGLVEVAKGRASGLGAWLAPVVTVVLLGTIGACLLKAYRAR